MNHASMQNVRTVQTEKMYVGDPTLISHNLDDPIHLPGGMCVWFNSHLRYINTQEFKC